MTSHEKDPVRVEAFALTFEESIKSKVFVSKKSFLSVHMRYGTNNSVQHCVHGHFFVSIGAQSSFCNL